MRDIIEVFSSPYSSFGDKCLAALVALVIVAAVGMLGATAFIVVDSVGITPTKTTATVVEMKQVVPAHTSIILAGKVIFSQYHPESYRIYFRIDGKVLSPSVDRRFFAMIEIGNRIEVDYAFRRLTGLPQPTEIRLATR